MPHYSSAINQSKKLISLLRAECSEYYAGETSFVMPTPIFDSVNSGKPANLISIMQKHCDIDITATIIDASSDKILAYCLRNNDSHKVYVIRQNPCWTRYYIAKELSHLLVFSNKNTTSTLEGLDDLLSGLINKGESLAVNAENIAYFAAIEMLIPSDIVPKLLNARGVLEDIVDDNSDGPNLRIAKKLLVPERIVEYRLDYADKFKEWYEESSSRA
ncbi:MAG: hypothetical protein A6F71_01125 [Cycloclasticus sp. symbiont of Poecilosclerida sp. M]|nr:MAG: hypothetical protein A6F71_01125 [Cycloclasticus sp. symbiont of Poecilosclerida sp. M]